MAQVRDGCDRGQGVLLMLMLFANSEQGGSSPQELSAVYAPGRPIRPYRRGRAPRGACDRRALNPSVRAGSMPHGQAGASPVTSGSASA
jgi:hypothetical protein